MDRWTHSICKKCWNRNNPDREPAVVTNVTKEVCCYCGTAHSSGIYLRADPQRVRCNGQGPVHQSQESS